jgi:hypothetical protein
MLPKWIHFSSLVRTNISNYYNVAVIENMINAYYLKDVALKIKYVFTKVAKQTSIQNKSITTTLQNAQLQKKHKMIREYGQWVLGNVIGHQTLNL